MTRKKIKKRYSNSIQEIIPERTEAQDPAFYLPIESNKWINVCADNKCDILHKYFRLPF